MKKLMMIAGAVALAGMIAGCATGGAGEDKVAKWQKERTPVEVLKSKIEIKAGWTGEASVHFGYLYGENKNADAVYSVGMNIPSNYKILFVQGGASTQFAAV